jgi:hypothetical protein
VTDSLARNPSLHCVSFFRELFRELQPLGRRAATPPDVNGTGQLIVNGQPFLILGGELGNSSAGTAAQAARSSPSLQRCTSTRFSHL